MSTVGGEDAEVTTTTRMAKDARARQLLDTAWRLAKESGTDALTLANVAQEAGVTKPIAYNHFGTRAGLLAALYGDFDEAQTAAMRDALDINATSLVSAIDVVSAAYVDCAIEAGPQVGSIVAALSGSKELEDMLRKCRDNHLRGISQAFEPFVDLTGVRGEAALIALVGASDELSQAAANGSIARNDAIEMLRLIMNSVLNAFTLNRPTKQ